MVRIIACVMLCLSCFSSVAMASDPLELTADEALEWHRDTQNIIARGNVIAKQGPVALHSQIMRASYVDGAGGDKFSLKTVTAETNVEIKTADGTAYGDKATYDLAENVAVLTGADLRMVSGEYTLRAGKHFKYDVTAGMLSAVGGANLLQKTDKGDNIIAADTLAAVFSESNGSERTLEKMTASGNVVITTPTEVITGDQGTYNKQTDIVTLSGNVAVKRGPNTLQGEHATVNLKTNISTLTGASGDSGRVKGVFYPE